ncbi:MAG: hypothetical protein ABI723_03220 [Bacteroidia bacterium]
MKTENKTYSIWKEGKYYVAQCLVVEVSSFGKTKAEALKNLNEALSLFMEKEQAKAKRNIVSKPTLSKEEKKLLLKRQKDHDNNVGKLYTWEEAKSEILKKKKVSKEKKEKLFRKVVEVFTKDWDKKGWTEKDEKKFLKMRLRTS